MRRREAVARRNTRLRAERDAALERARGLADRNRQLEEELLRQERLVANLAAAQERDTETVGILADVVDILFGDDDRCARHGYEGVIERAKDVTAFAISRGWSS